MDRIDILVEQMSEEAIDFIVESDLETLYDYLDHISTLNENSISFLGDRDLFLLYEAVADKNYDGIGFEGQRRIASMVHNHRGRDFETFDKGKAKNFSPENNAHHTLKNFIGRRSRDYQKQIQNLAAKGKSKDEIDAEIKPKVKEEENQLKHLSKKLGDRFQVSSTDSAGNTLHHKKWGKQRYGLMSRSRQTGSNVAGMYHAKKNDRRGEAATRLRNYLEGKRKHVVRDASGKPIRGKDGKMKTFYDEFDRDKDTGHIKGRAKRWTEDEYTAANDKTMERANNAKLNMFQKGKAFSGRLLKVASDKDLMVNCAELPKKKEPLTQKDIIKNSNGISRGQMWRKNPDFAENVKRNKPRRITNRLK